MYKAKVVNLLTSLAIILWIYSLFVLFQNGFIKNLVEEKYYDYTYLNLGDNNELYFSLGILIAYFAGAYKHNMEMRKENDLTI